MYSFVLSFILILLNLWVQPDLQFLKSSDVKNNVPAVYPFNLGEKLYYKMNYSIFTVGKAEISIYPVEYTISKKDCYKIDVYGKTAGAAAIVSRVNDNWGSFVEVDSLKPLKSWRIIEEGKFRKKEYVDFDHVNGEVNVRVVNNETGVLEEPVTYDFTDPQMLDLISGYAYLRTIDFTKFKVGDTLKMKGFFEDKFYKFNILYMGTEKIKTKLGKIMAYKLVPVMPDNKLFAGENSISAWFAADGSKLPLKVEAKMFIGRAGCEITGYEGLKINPLFID